MPNNFDTSIEAKKFNKLTIILMKTSCFIAMLQTTLSENPIPTWPGSFKMDFTETSKMLFTFNNSGTYQYDQNNKRYRMDRTTSKGDRQCMGTNPLSNSPCTHQVVEGIRQLFFNKSADDQSCCNCCSNEHGCGVIKPTWAMEGTQSDSEISPDGDEVYKFEVKGLQSNYQYVTKTGVPARINMMPNDDISFKTSSYLEVADWGNTFDLPQKCVGAKMCQGICTAVRLNKANENQCKAHYCD